MLTKDGVLVQRGGVLDADLGTGLDGGDLLEVSELHLEGATVVQALGHDRIAAGDLSVVDIDLDGVLVEGQAPLLDIMEGEVVGLVAGVVGSHGTFELERDVVAHVPVGGILPVGKGALSVVGVLQFLLEGRDVGLRSDGDVLVHDLHDVGGVGVELRAFRRVLILDQIVTGRDGCGGVTGDGRVRITVKVRVSFQGVGLLLVRARDGGDLGQSGIVDGRPGGAGAVLAPLDVGQLATGRGAGEDLIDLIGVSGARDRQIIGGLIRERSTRAHETSDRHGNGGEHRNQSVDCPLHN